MRKGIAYVYLSLLMATAVAIGVLAAMSTYIVKPVNTQANNEVIDKMLNITNMKMIGHYCLAKASVDPYVGRTPNIGYTYNIEPSYNVYARSSGRPEISWVECYNMTKEPSSSTTIVRGITVTTTVDPAAVRLTERFGLTYLRAVMTTYTLPVVYVNNSLGVADFKIKIYYKTVVEMVDNTGHTILEESIPIKFAESTLQADGTTRDYPVKINQSDRSGYDWVITTSFVLDPTGPNSYTININLYLFNGIKQVIEIRVQW